MREWDEEFRPDEHARWGQFRLYYDVIAQCLKCNHRTQLSVRWLDRMFRHDELVMSIEERLRCQECKAKKAIIRVRQKPR